MGDEILPDFSPDGKQVVYIWMRDASADVFVQMVDSAARLQLTKTAEPEWSPAWSPDGHWIAFIRTGASGSQLFMIPPIGGPERKIADDICAGTGLSWSADSRWLACAGPRGSGLSLIAVNSGESRQLTSIGKDAQHLAPSFSPDGRSLLYVRCVALSDCDLYVLSLDTGLNVQVEPRPATREHLFTRSVRWTSDGRNAIFHSPMIDAWLHRVPVFRAGPSQQLAFAGTGARDPAVSRHGGRLVYAKEHSDVNILWTQGGPAERHPVSSTRLDANAVFSPDGKRIAFTSSRSGTTQVWMANVDGSQPVQRTRLGEHSASPQWSPDGRWIAFDSLENGRWDVWIVGTNGGAPRRITNYPSDSDEPSFSQDGKWIYFSSTRSGRSDVYRVPFAGGKEEQVTTGGGSLARESPDGKRIYHALTHSLLSTLMETPVTGGKGRPLDITFTARAFHVVPDGIYFMAPPDSASEMWVLAPPTPLLRSRQLTGGSKASETRNYASIQFYDFATKTVRELHRVRNNLRVGRGFSVSPDRKTFLYPADEGTGWDLMLVENFR
jgi:Tol biopolymer transport system component